MNISTITQLDEVLQKYLVTKAPAIPDDIQELIVKFSPWISLIMGLMLLPVLLAALGISALFMPLAMMGGATYTSFGLVFAIATLALQFASISPLMKREILGWKLVYWSVLINLILSLVNGGIVGGLISALISFYILFQVKNKYK